MPKKFVSNCARGILLVGFLNRAEDGVAGIADNNVEPSERGDGSAHGFPDLLLAAYVEVDY
ncbi:hypothetical protein [Rhizobium lusitanum]|uniref:hypothetical protein n=1 Tax=Rhizobium lusitanum TaxID=293958 RepID=UPI00248688C8|nr:hypothetical protein [Rhizobium lusitanum]